MLYNSTRDNNAVVESSTAIAHGISVEGGLFVPQSVPKFSAEDFAALKKLDYVGRAQYVFKNSVGISIPRVSKDQSKHGQFVSRSELQRGDLVFFDTSGDGAVNHVGIYMGENQFIHASSGGGKVVISEMNSYYSPRYINARRVL